MKKFFSLVLFTMLFSARIFSASGVLWGEKDIRTVSTRWFDIIYPSRSAESVLELYNCADRVYEEVCSNLGINPQFRMTVTVTPAIDALNAYFTNFPSNHIVIYDCPVPDSLAVFNNNMEDKFRHELTHAVTINMRSPFWKALDFVLGDSWNFGCYITMPTLIKEGASVVEESRGGGGRLNDGFYLHVLRQSILQKKFQSYTELTGARDIWPQGNLSYAFGGPFSDWLQKEYGMESYSKFWYTGINMGAVTYEHAFKKVYGFSLGEAWEKFLASVNLPDIPENPDSLDGVDFYRYGKSSGKVYTSLTSSRDGIAWIESSSAFFARTVDGGIGGPKKLFSLTGLSSIKFSNDGRYLAVSRMETNHGTTRNEVCVYDMESGRMAFVPELSLRDAAVLDVDGEKYLAAVKTCGGKFSLSVWKIATNSSGTPVSFDFVRSYAFASTEMVFSPVDSDSGRVAFLLKDGALWSLCVANLLQDGDEFSAMEIELGEGVSARNLSFDSSDCGSRLLFSWAARDTFPRLGLAKLSDGGAELSLMDSDLSGGVYFPVSIGNQKSFAHLGNFVTENKILVADVGAFSFENQSAKIRTRVFGEKNPVTSDLDALSKKYYGGLEKGTVFPFSSVPVYSIYGDGESQIFFPGLSYVSRNPWDGIQLEIMAGVNPGVGVFRYFQDPSFEAGFTAKISGGADSDVFKYAFTFQTAFDSAGYMQSSLDSELSSTVMLGGTGFFAFKNEALVFYGRDSSYTADRKFLTFRDHLSAQIGFSQKTGQGKFERLSFFLLGSMDFLNLNRVDGGFENLVNYVHVFPSLIAKIPRLIPVDCVGPVTYNLPASFCFSLAPSITQVFGGYATLMLADWEIQKGPPVFPLYFNRLVATVSYVFGMLDSSGGVNALNAPERLFSSKNLIWSDTIRLTGLLQCTVNTGALANPQVLASIGATVNFYPHKISGSSPVSVSLATSLNF
ncbi:MAG: hypothetical protein IIU15_06525 [Treponema sp.]|nr:hypothetical protein [Treponema sp.]